MHTHPDHNAAFLRLLSLEYNCTPADFLRSENLLTASAAKEGGRIYSESGIHTPYFFHMVTFGGNAVVTADTALHPFLETFIKDRPGHWLFEQPNLRPLEAELNRHGYTLTASHHMFITESTASVPLKQEYPVKWFFDEDIRPFYGKGFPNALCEKFLPHRPDRIAVCACDGDRIMGMAGCSEDAPGMMQIGIDVMPAYRSAGVGTYLVSLLKNKILERGDIPFYGTSLSNYHSWNIALNCGFRPAFVEIGAGKMK